MIDWLAEWQRRTGNPYPSGWNPPPPHWVDVVMVVAVVLALVVGLWLGGGQ